MLLGDAELETKVETGIRPESAQEMVRASPTNVANFSSEMPGSTLTP
jgi:hypothetical protein